MNGASLRMSDSVELRTRHDKSTRMRTPTIRWLLLLGTLLIVSLARSPAARATSPCSYCTDIGLACNTTTQTCMPCTPTDGCTERQECDVSRGVCRVKGVFTPFLPSNGILIVLVFCGAGLANAGGVGGGVLLVPFLALFGGFNFKNASANAQPLIFAATLANVSFNLRKRHAARDAPRIDWNLVLNTVPFFLAATTLGTFLNATFPSFFTAFILSVVMLALAVQSGVLGTRLARHQLRARREARRRLRESREVSGDEREPVSDRSVARPASTDVERGTTDESQTNRKTTADGQCSDVVANGVHAPSPATRDAVADGEPNTGDKTAEHRIDEERSEHATTCSTEAKPAASAHRLRLWRRLDPVLLADSLPDMLDAERPWFQWRYMLVIFLCWLVLFILRLLSGSQDAHSVAGVSLCGAAYWVLFAIQETALLGVGVLVSWRNLALRRRRNALGYPWYEHQGLGDVHWGGRIAYVYPPWAFLVGVAGAWLGLGGSALLIPFLNLVAHTDPVIVQSSMSVVNFVGSAGATFVYLVGGRLDISFGLFYGLFALLGSYTGVMLVYFLVDRYHLKGMFLFALMIAFSISFAIALYFGIHLTQGVVAAGVGWVTTNICAFQGG